MPVPLPVLRSTLRPPTPVAPVAYEAAPEADDADDDGGQAEGGMIVPGNTDRASLIAAMEKSGWVQAKAARLLGLTPRQIGYAMRKHGIAIQKF
jgi:Nif-specific regulatory protein